MTALILQLHLKIYIKYDKSYDLGDEILFLELNVIRVVLIENQV